MVRSCDVYIGLIGLRYGSPVRDRPDVSYTELEFDTATEAGLQRLIFMLDVDAAVPIPPARLLDNELDRQVRQREFRAKLLDAGLTVSVFSSPEGLQLEVLHALQSRPAAVAGIAESQVVAGEIPREPPGYVTREVLGRLGDAAERGTAASCVVIGLRGVGKTQLAAAYARARVSDGWPLVGWVNAESPEVLLAGLARVAGRLGVADPEGDSAESARRLREHLDTTTRPGLVVFDNAADPDVLRPFLLAAGNVQVVITTTHRAIADLGVAVDVPVFTRAESAGYLAARTGLTDAAGADEVAAELGDLPLALAQAAAAISGQHLGYQQYLARLGRVPVSSLLGRVPGGGYPLPLASALLLSIEAVQDADQDGLAGRLLRVVAVLSPDGVRRGLLAGLAGGDQAARETALDEAAQRCVAGSLLTWSVTGDQL
jgi:hypothetical protein